MNNVNKRRNDQTETDLREGFHDRNIWERLETESDKAFFAFTCYRDMAKPRNLHGAEEEYSKAYGKHRKGIESASGFIRNWACQNNWVERVKAYDDHLDSVKIEAVELNIKHEYARMIANAKWLEKRAMEELRNRDFDAESIRELRIMLENSMRLQSELYKADGLTVEKDNNDSIKKWLAAVQPSPDVVRRIFETKN